MKGSSVIIASTLLLNAIAQDWRRLSTNPDEQIIPFNPLHSLVEIKHQESDMLANIGTYYTVIVTTLYRSDFSIFGKTFMKFFKNKNKVEGEIRMGKTDQKSSAIPIQKYFCFDYRKDIMVFPQPIVWDFTSEIQAVIYTNGFKTIIPILFNEIRKGVLCNLSILAEMKAEIQSGLVTGLSVKMETTEYLRQDSFFSNSFYRISRTGSVCPETSPYASTEGALCCKFGIDGGYCLNGECCVDSVWWFCSQPPCKSFVPGMCSRSTVSLDANIISSKNLPTKLGTELSISCPNDLILASESERLTCEVKEDNNGSTSPMCLFRRDVCLKYPPDWKHFTAFDHVLLIGQSISMKCDRGYKNFGSVVATCNGTDKFYWNETEVLKPNCKPVLTVTVKSNGFGDTNLFSLKELVIFYLITLAA